MMRFWVSSLRRTSASIASSFRISASMMWNDLRADLLRLVEELDVLVLVQVVQHHVRQVDDLLARQLHRMMPFSLAIFFLSILNMSV